MFKNDCALNTNCPLLLQLENIGNFVRAIQDYGLRPHDIFEANDLFENVNHTQVQSTLITLAGMVSELQTFLSERAYIPPFISHFHADVFSVSTHIS